MGFKSGLWLGHSRRFTFLFWSHSSVVLAVCLGSLSCWNINLRHSLRSFSLWSRFSSRICLYLAPFIVPSILRSLPVLATEKHPYSMMVPLPCFTVGMVFCARCLLDIALCFQAKEFNFHFIRPHNLLPHALRVFHVPFCKLQVCCHVPYSQEWLLFGHSPIKSRFVKCCRDCCPQQVLPSLPRTLVVLSDWLLGSLSLTWRRSFLPGCSVWSDGQLSEESG